MGGRNSALFLVFLSHQREIKIGQRERSSGIDWEWCSSVREECVNCDPWWRSHPLEGHIPERQATMSLIQEIRGLSLMGHPPLQQACSTLKVGYRGNGSWHRLSLRSSAKRRPKAKRTDKNKDNREIWSLWFLELQHTSHSVISSQTNTNLHT